MLPAQFDYIVASSVEEAIAAKAEGGDETRFLAGGQSLLPMMKLRFATPSKLVDINRIAGLDTIEHHNGHLQVGALVRHADIAASDAVSGAVASAAPWISDPLVRNLGTLCGSVAHCDPEGDWNSVLLATGAEVVAQGPSGRRSIAIGDFVRDFFTNSLADDEMVAAVHIPVPSGRSGGSYQKLERKVGDYATVGVATHLVLDGSGNVAEAGLGLTAVYGHNLKVTEAEEMMAGQTPGPEMFAEAAAIAARACDPDDNVRGPAEYKRAVVAEYTRRGFARALAQARGEG
jgi:carbon-monoxide dehydrogenase medium subunit